MATHELSASPGRTDCSNETWMDLMLMAECDTLSSHPYIIYSILYQIHPFGLTASGSRTSIFHPRIRPLSSNRDDYGGPRF